MSTDAAEKTECRVQEGEAILLAVTSPGGCRGRASENHVPGSEEGARIVSFAASVGA
jgi:hypothetical protein